MRLNCVLVLCEQQLQNAAFCLKSFVFTCLTYKNVQRFWNGPVHEFYGLKASQMSKVQDSHNGTLLQKHWDTMLCSLGKTFLSHRASLNRGV